LVLEESCRHYPVTDRLQPKDHGTEDEFEFEFEDDEGTRT
jgi:hypothetical protein